MCVHLLYMYDYVVAKLFSIIYVRYCVPSGPIERFLTFIHVRSYILAAILAAILGPKWHQRSKLSRPEL